mmetsp:Transcript_44913/g.103799  ORF Transcript_44913/g.103799 Transcript_44913/m.103799 type:complete len:242 (-) Transcript_44913:193-918(-)
MGVQPPRTVRLHAGRVVDGAACKGRNDIARLQQQDAPVVLVAGKGHHLPVVRLPVEAHAGPVWVAGHVEAVHDLAGAVVNDFEAVREGARAPVDPVLGGHGVEELGAAEWHGDAVVAPRQGHVVDKRIPTAQLGLVHQPDGSADVVVEAAVAELGDHPVLGHVVDGVGALEVEVQQRGGGLVHIHVVDTWRYACVYEAHPAEVGDGAIGQVHDAHKGLRARGLDEAPGVPRAMVWDCGQWR